MARSPPRKRQSRRRASRPSGVPPRPSGGPSPRRVEIRGAPGSRLAVYFDYAADLIAEIERVPGSRWDARGRCWSLPAEPAALGFLVSRFRAEDLALDERAERLLPTSGLEGVRWRRLARRERSTGAGRSTDAGRSTGEGCEAALRRMREELVLRGYSPRTRKLYLNQTRRFLDHARLPPARLGVEHVRAYLRWLVDERGLSHSYADQNVSALKFFFERALGRPLDDLDLPRPKRERKLPTVLGKQEVLAIFDAIENRKHRAILMLVYAAGLRVSEVVRLQPADVDAERGTLHVRQGKGRKDRYVPLSDVALRALEQYLRYRKEPGKWLFPGQKSGRHLTTRTVQHVFAKARKRAGIEKRATVHTLRHSYATHLHEGGVGLRYIQALLGHKSPSTTEIYTHVSRTDLANIQSPLDQIMRPDDELD